MRSEGKKEESHFSEVRPRDGLLVVFKIVKVHPLETAWALNFDAECVCILQVLLILDFRV